MRLLISAIAALTVATRSGCGASGPSRTAELEQAITQTCAAVADCSPFADQCLATQIMVRNGCDPPAGTQRGSGRSSA
jgi:hypothetical protein